MKSTLTAIAMIVALGSITAISTLPAYAKGIDHMIKKKARKGTVPVAYNHGDYHMVCFKTGDCANWNIAG
jgi:hypothetical protein